MKELDELQRAFDEYDRCIQEIDRAFSQPSMKQVEHEAVVVVDDDDLFILHALVSKTVQFSQFDIPDISRAGCVYLNRNWAETTSTPSSVFPSGGQYPRGIALSQSGKHVIVAHTWSHILVVLSLDGNVIRTIGGQAGSGEGQFSCPYGVAVDASGNVWVADLGNKRVQCLTEQGQFIHAFSTPLQPYAITFLSNGYLAISFYDGGKNNNRIIVYTPEGKEDRTIGSYGTGNGQLGVRVSDIKASHTTDELFVADSSNHRVQVFAASDGRWLRSFGGNAEEMNYPTGLALAPDGHVIVVECWGHRVSVWSPTGQRVHRWGSLGEGPGQFKGPWHAALLQDGRVAVADSENNRIQIF